MTPTEIAALLNKWADELEIPSGDFVNEDLRRAAALISSLVAENEELRGQTYLASAEAAEHHRDNAITMWHDERTKRETAERLLAEAREAAEALNATDAELVRIHNMCTGIDGEVKIWSKMLHKLAVFAIATRAALGAQP